MDHYKTQHGADNVAFAAAHGGAADDRCRDGTAFSLQAQRGGGNTETGGGEHTGNGGQQGGDHIQHDLDPLDPHTRHFCGFGVAADEIDLGKESGLGKEDLADNGGCNEENKEDGNTAQISGTKILKAADGFSRDGDGDAGGDHITQASDHALHTQRDDEGDNIQLGNQAAGDGAAYHADDNADEYRQPDVYTFVNIQRADKHGGKALYGSQRKIDLAGDKDKCHSQGQKAVCAEAKGNAHEVVDGEKGLGSAGHDDHDQQNDAGYQYLPLFEECKVQLTHFCSPVPGQMFWSRTE